MSKPRKRYGAYYARRRHAEPYRPWKGAPRWTYEPEPPLPWSFLAFLRMLIAFRWR